MRHVSRLAVGLAVLSSSLVACSSDSSTFDVEQVVPLERVDGNALGEELGDVMPVPIRLELQAQIDERDPGPIGSVKLTSMPLQVITDTSRNCPGGTWSFLESIELFVEAPGQPRVRIAAADGPGNVKQLILRPTSPAVDLVPYLATGATLTATGMGRAPTSSVCYEGVARFTVQPQ